MAEYIDRDEVLEYRETVTTDDYSGNETLDVVAVEEILEVEPADVVELSKIDSAIKEMKALADPRNTILGFDEKMGVKVAINILLRNSGYAPDTNVWSKMQEEQCEDCVSRKSLIHKLQERHDFFVNAYGGFINLPKKDKARVDAITTCIAMLVDEPPVKPVACIAKVNFNKEDMQEILDKIIDEIEALPKTYPYVFGSIYRIINKYKAAEELRMEKHTDRQIYDGCILLMQKMVDYFQEYLEYLGYDLDKLDEDERFAVEMSNMEIIRQLFLYRTGNSGGCSTRDFCKKLGVDPYKSVKFEFEESEEE